MFAERVDGIEPTSSGWKPEIITIIRYSRIWVGQTRSAYRDLVVATTAERTETLFIIEIGESLSLFRFFSCQNLLMELLRPSFSFVFSHHSSIGSVTYQELLIVLTFSLL